MHSVPNNDDSIHPLPVCWCHCTWIDVICEYLPHVNWTVHRMRYTFVFSSPSGRAFYLCSSSSQRQASWDQNTAFKSYVEQSCALMSNGNILSALWMHGYGLSYSSQETRKYFTSPRVPRPTAHTSKRTFPEKISMNFVALRTTANGPFHTTHRKGEIVHWLPNAHKVDMI